MKTPAVSINAFVSILSYCDSGGLLDGPAPFTSRVTAYNKVSTVEASLFALVLVVTSAGLLTVAAPFGFISDPDATSSSLAVIGFGGWLRTMLTKRRRPFSSEDASKRGELLRRDWVRDGWCKFCDERIDRVARGMKLRAPPAR